MSAGPIQRTVARENKFFVRFISGDGFVADNISAVSYLSVHSPVESNSKIAGCMSVLPWFDEMREREREGRLSFCTFVRNNVSQTIPVRT